MIRRYSLWILVMSYCFFVGGCILNAMHTNHGPLQAQDLRCEYRVDPLGIDVVNPRLSWVLDSDERGQKQTAYHILVAASRETLDQNQGDLWDSGKVNSDATRAVVYKGRPLTSETRCFWKVKVWDKDGNPSGWSAPAEWSMGLLKPDDWKAQWIGYDVPIEAPSTPDVIKKADWIWTDANAKQGTAPVRRYFRRTFEIPRDFKIESAICYITADDAFVLYVNGHQVKSGQGHAYINEVSIAGDLHPGKNVLAVRGANVGDSDNPAALLAAVTIRSADGKVLEVVSDDQWRIAEERVDNWQSPDFDDASWGKAIALCKFGMAPWEVTRYPHKVLPPARYLRGECSLADKKIKNATLYATSLGIYQLYMNGQHVTSDYFSPGWTDYAKRVCYRTYDVTDIAQKGTNAVGAVLADGWFAGYIGYARKRNYYGENLRLLCQLNVDYEDGTRQVFAGGPDWKGSLGPILQADFLQGETYDARRQMPGWSTAGFDDSAWASVTVGGNEVDPKVQAAISQPVVAFAEVKPVSISEPVPGQYVFNMGQNFAGVVKIRVKGKPGQHIQLRHAERLNPDGTIYTTNLRSAAATDTYICSGDGTETWQPYFTFHGFQYVEVTGLDYKPKLDAIVGLALSSDTPVAGTFECSNSMVNQIQSNAVWTQRANFIDIPTDCPQRDERLGWTGDAQVYINTACYENDVQAFFTKWLIDLTDAQRSDGQFPMVAPLKVSGDDGGPAWADAGVICPWTIYKMYGDHRIIESHYDAMKKFIAFCKGRSTDELLPPAQFHCFGDWLNINDDTPKDVIYTAYFAYSTNLLARMADAIGKTEDSKYYHELFEQIKQAFNRAYVQPDGRIKGDSQTAYVLAIGYDLLDGPMQAKAADQLIRRIRECEWHLSTGFVGTKDLMLVLAKIGRNDVAYRLLLNDTFPSWGFSIKQGATSIWERWNGWTPEQGFNDPGMNSFAHYSFGAVCQWMFENIGGIRTDGPGFKHIVLKPQPGGELTWAKTTYDSIRGPVCTDWKIDEGRFRCRVTIPPNTTATLYLPAAAADTVTESKRPIEEANGLLSVSYQSGTMILKLGSGQYDFKSQLP